MNLIELAEHPRRRLFAVALIRFIFLSLLLLAVVGEIFDMWANGRWFVDMPPELFLISCLVPLSGLFALKFTRIEVVRIQAQLEIYCKRNEFEKAHSLIEKQLSHPMKSFLPSFKGMKAYLLIKERKYDEGRLLARKLTEEFPHYPFGWYLLAYLESRVGHLGDAKDSLQKALKLFEKNWKKHPFSANKTTFVKYLLQDVEEDQYLKNLI